MDEPPPPKIRELILYSDYSLTNYRQEIRKKEANPENCLFIGKKYFVSGDGNRVAINESELETKIGQKKISSEFLYNLLLMNQHKTDIYVPSEDMEALLMYVIESNNAINKANDTSLPKFKIKELSLRV